MVYTISDGVLEARPWPRGQIFEALALALESRPWPWPRGLGLGLGLEAYLLEMTTDIQILPEV